MKSESTSFPFPWIAVWQYFISETLGTICSFYNDEMSSLDLQGQKSKASLLTVHRGLLGTHKAACLGKQSGYQISLSSKFHHTEPVPNKSFWIYWINVFWCVEISQNNYLNAAKYKLISSEIQNETQSDRTIALKSRFKKTLRFPPNSWGLVSCGETNQCLACRCAKMLLPLCLALETMTCISCLILESLILSKWHFKKSKLREGKKKKVWKSAFQHNRLEMYHLHYLLRSWAGD